MNSQKIAQNRSNSGTRIKDSPIRSVLHINIEHLPPLVTFNGPVEVNLNVSMLVNLVAGWFDFALPEH